ncbi:MAG: class I SAM-dependent methyltransferase [Pirellulaceae bacterium]|nr:class I SAM-dependent methyltransferase [Pirellulaceae bacterium]
MESSTPNTSVSLTPIEWELTTCCICHSSGYRVVRETVELLQVPRVAYTLVACSRCGHAFINPRPKLASIGKFYPADYGPHREFAQPSAPVSQTVDEPARTEKPREHSHWAAAIPGLRSAVLWLLESDSEPIPIVEQPSPKALEIGCGAGRFLDRLESKGWTVRGLEPADVPAQRCRDRGLAVQTGNIESTDLPENLFDIVFAWMVLEHVHQPEVALSKIANALTSNGILMFSVPNFGCWEPVIFRKYWFGFQLVHLNYFTVPELKKLLERTGFEIEAVTHQSSVRNIIGSLGLFLRDRRGLKAFGDWLVEFAGDMSMWSQLALSPIAKGLCWLRQSGRITIQARKVD